MSVCLLTFRRGEVNSLQLLFLRPIGQTVSVSGPVDKFEDNALFIPDYAETGGCLIFQGQPEAGHVKVIVKWLVVDSDNPVISPDPERGQRSLKRNRPDFNGGNQPVFQNKSQELCPYKGFFVA